MRRSAPLAAALVALAACASQPPSPERLAKLGSVAVVARLPAEGPRSRLNEDEATRALLARDLSAAEADERLAAVLRKIEGNFELETRFRGELVDALGHPAPFEVVPEAAVSAATGSLLVRPEGPPSYKALARAGVEAVLELVVQEIELVPASGSRPAGLRIQAKARPPPAPDDEELWSSASLELVPDPGSALVVDPEALKADPERAWLEAVGAAADAIGEQLGRELVSAGTTTP